MEENKNVETKNPLSFILRFIKALFIIILIILICLAAWFTFASFDRTASSQAIPADYAVFLRTDSAWDTLSPLLDVEAVQVILSTPEFSTYRELYLKLKTSSLRENPLVQKALQRRIDAALYENGYVAVLDTGFLAGLSRLVPYFLRWKYPEKFTYIKSDSYSYFKFNDTTYFAFHKNLLLIFSDQAFLSCLNFNARDSHSEKELAAMEGKLEEPLQIVADSRKLMALFSGLEENPYAAAISQALDENELALLNFGISDSDFNLKIELPFSLPDNLKGEETVNPVLLLLARDSAVPTLLPKLPQSVQYYTLISAGSLEEIKNAAAKALPAEKHFEENWNKAQSFSNMIFHKSLEDVLFSWTGDQFAVFGIEGKAEPVIAIKISDEKKRKEIFETVFSSIILQTNDSLLMDGVRLPCIEIPPFFTSLLNMFGFNLQMPYFLVKDDFIYFSQSPENLISLNYSVKRNTRLSKSENWKRVSSKQSPQSSMSLFYNLERSLPFFLSGKSALQNVLRLYNIGRMDLNVSGGKLTVQLQAAAVEKSSLQNVAGFPMKLEGKAQSTLILLESKKKHSVCWLEQGGNLKSLNLSDFSITEKHFDDLRYILAASDKESLWAVTKEGLVYLLNQELEIQSGFPLLTGVNLSCPPVESDSKLLLCDEDSSLHFVSADGNVTLVETEALDPVLSAPATLDSPQNSTIAFYEKGFFGGIHVFKNQLSLTGEHPLELEGIAYGSPCIFKEGKAEYIAMITQSGLLYLYDENMQLVENFPLQLEGLYYTNVKYSEGALFALSSEGQLSRVSLSGQVESVKIPYFSAKSGKITVADYDNDKKTEIFVTGDGNIMYGFDSSLEMLCGFPLAGFGNPVFFDINGDKKNDLLVITFDNNLAGYNL
ncbi:MAG: VCBS repeat-containing protein [Treponema sp.]|nr:VCBS repeat-containing protein [Treponema sp.]